MRADRHRILVLYYHPHAAPMRTAVYRHLHAIERSRRPHRLLYYNVACGAPAWLRHARFDAVILHTTFLALRWTDDFPERKWSLRWVGDLDCAKIAIPQDEYDHAEVLDEWLYEWNVGVVFSNFDRPQRELLYPIMGRKAIFQECFTGYIDEEDAARMRARLLPTEARPKDLVYRAAHLPYWFGSQGQLKHGIAAAVAPRAAAVGLSCDISTRAEDAIVGQEWLDFLGSGRAVLGCESGSSVIDRRGEIKAGILALTRTFGDAPFGAVSARMPAGWDTHAFVAVSPRHFEAVITKTCQVLVEGHYNGIFEPFNHYIPLKRSLSNLDEVLNLVRDRQLVERVAARAYQDIYASRRYCYARFAEAIERAIDLQTEALGDEAGRRVYGSRNVIWRAGKASARLTHETLRWRQRAAQRTAAAPAFYRAAMHPIVALVKAAVAVKLILNNGAKRAMLHHVLRVERNHKTFGFGAILVDLLMWSLLEEVRTGRCRLVPDADTHVLVKVSRDELLFQTQRGPEAIGSAANYVGRLAGSGSAAGGLSLRRIVWDNSAVGDQVLCPVTASRRVTFFMPRDGIYEFKALARFAEARPKEFSEWCSGFLSCRLDRTSV
jgi:hypothetical protein